MVTGLKKSWLQAAAGFQSTFLWLVNLLLLLTSLSTPEASDSTLDYVWRLNYGGMHPLFHNGGSSESGNKLCWRCDKNQLLLNDNKTKQAADTCHHPGVRSFRLSCPAGSRGWTLSERVWQGKRQVRGKSQVLLLRKLRSFSESNRLDMVYKSDLPVNFVLLWTGNLHQLNKQKGNIRGKHKKPAHLSSLHLPSLEIAALFR